VKSFLNPGNEFPGYEKAVIIYQLNSFGIAFAIEYSAGIDS
jgi:hypothetical protein